MLQRARTKKTIRRASKLFSSLPTPESKPAPEPEPEAVPDVKMDEEKMSGVTVDDSEYHSLPVEKISTSIFGDDSTDFRSMSTTTVTPRSDNPHKDLRADVPVMNGADLDDVQASTTKPKDDARAQLSKWSSGSSGLEKINIIKLSTEEVASAMAAHLINYEQGQEARFAKIKDALAARFRDKHIFGRSIAYADDYTRTKLLVSSLTAIATVVDDEAVCFLKPLVKEFIRVVSKLD